MLLHPVSQLKSQTVILGCNLPKHLCHLTNRVPLSCSELGACRASKRTSGISHIQHGAPERIDLITSQNFQLAIQIKQLIHSLRELLINKGPLNLSGSCQATKRATDDATDSRALANVPSNITERQIFQRIVTFHGGNSSHFPDSCLQSLLPKAKANSFEHIPAHSAKQGSLTCFDGINSRCCVFSFSSSEDPGGCLHHLATNLTLLCSFEQLQ